MTLDISGVNTCPKRSIYIRVHIFLPNVEATHGEAPHRGFSELSKLTGYANPLSMTREEPLDCHQG